MKNSGQINQETVDALLLKSDKKQSMVIDLPKGLTEETLSTIVQQIFHREKGAFSAADVATETGISRVSIRKYLNFLVENRMLHLDVLYQETGRPLNQYILNPEDRKSTRLNSSHVAISYAVFCLKKKKNNTKTGSLPSYLTATVTGNHQ